MVEAVSAVSAVSEVPMIEQCYPQEEGNDSNKKVTALFKDSTNTISSSSRTLKGSITAVIPDQELAAKITTTLQEKGFFTCDKNLGDGAFGQVLQVEGSDKKKYALKVIPKTTSVFRSSAEPIRLSFSSSVQLSSRLLLLQGIKRLVQEIRRLNRIETPYKANFPSSSTSFRPPSTPSIDPDHPIISGNWRLSRISKEKGIVGDGIALNFSKTGQLTAAYALLLFNGEKVEYVEKVDIERDNGKAVIGTLSDVATGGALYQHISKFSPGSDTVKGYGKDLAIGLHELHSLGYAHRDLHLKNVLIFENDLFSSARLADFGLSRKISEKTKRKDWKSLGIIIRYMDSSKDPALRSLLYHPTKGLLSPKSVINEEETLNHPYFLKSNTSASPAARL